MWNANRSFERADEAIAEGRLWRAKEILQGHIAVQDFHAELYERYGQLLLRMSDLAEAGKYLFLSGARKSEYEASIRLFLDKHRRDPERIYHALPRQAKRTLRGGLPLPVRQELDELGFTQRPHRLVEERKTTWKDALATFVLRWLIGRTILGVGREGARGRPWSGHGGAISGSAGSAGGVVGAWARHAGPPVRPQRRPQLVAVSGDVAAWVRAWNAPAWTWNRVVTMFRQTYCLPE